MSGHGASAEWSAAGMQPIQQFQQPMQLEGMHMQQFQHPTQPSALNIFNLAPVHSMQFPSGMLPPNLSPHGMQQLSPHGRVSTVAAGREGREAVLAVQGRMLSRSSNYAQHGTPCDLPMPTCLWSKKHQREGKYELVLARAYSSVHFFLRQKGGGITGGWGGGETGNHKKKRFSNFNQVLKTQKLKISPPKLMAYN